MYLNDLTLQANWTGGANNNWDAILNWNGQVPNLQDSTAAFPNVGVSANIVVNSDEHVGQLFFDNPSGYTFTGSGDITMDVLNHAGGTGAFATVTVNSGNQTIAVPLNLTSDTHFTIAANSSLAVTGVFERCRPVHQQRTARAACRFRSPRVGPERLPPAPCNSSPKPSPTAPRDRALSVRCRFHQGHSI